MLRVTPAMEAGITDHVWDLEEIIIMAAQTHNKTRRSGFSFFVSSLRSLFYLVSCALIRRRLRSLLFSLRFNQACNNGFHFMVGESLERIPHQGLITNPMKRP